MKFTPSLTRQVSCYVAGLLSLVAKLTLFEALCGSLDLWKFYLLDFIGKSQSAITCMMFYFIQKALAAVLLILVTAQKPAGLAGLCLEAQRLNAGVCVSLWVSFPLGAGEGGSSCCVLPPSPPLLLCHSPDVFQIANGQKIAANRGTNHTEITNLNIEK